MKLSSLSAKKRAAVSRFSTHARPDKAKMPIITLTGERDNDHFLVKIDGKPVELIASCLQALVALIIARATKPCGYVSLSSVTVSRLRMSVNGAAKGTGMRLIPNGSGTEYRLAIPHTDLFSHVVIEEPFFELVERGLITADEANELRKELQAC